VILAAEGAVGGVEVRGSAPGTRETDLLRPDCLVEKVQGVLLTGGSAFGLAAATGVMAFLEEQGKGFATGSVRVPIVPAAVLYDLDVGDPAVRPDAALGYLACRAAAPAPMATGLVGAGTGATVGKLLGMGRACRGGVGSWSETLPGGVVVAALAAVNALGEIVDPRDGRILAGVRGDEPGQFLSAMELLKNTPPPAYGRNTTLAVVATNSPLTKAMANKVASMAHDGLARAIRPVHTLYDGDTIFALSTLNGPRTDPSVLGAVAAQVVAQAVVNAVSHFESKGSIPAGSSWRSVLKP